MTEDGELIQPDPTATNWYYSHGPHVNQAGRPYWGSARWSPFEPDYHPTIYMTLYHLLRHMLLEGRDLASDPTVHLDRELALLASRYTAELKHLFSPASSPRP